MAFKLINPEKVVSCCPVGIRKSKCPSIGVTRMLRRELFRLGIMPDTPPERLETLRKKLRDKKKAGITADCPTCRYNTGQAPRAVEPEVRPEVKTKPKAKPKAEAKPKAKAEAKPKTEARPKAEAKPEAEEKSKVEVKPKAETKPKTEARPKAETKPEAEAETGTKTEEKAPPAG
ncbi:MAG: hypothetical protein V3W00_07235 [Candidatus Brocadiales bacterium]|jgi:hypothetical protein